MNLQTSAWADIFASIAAYNFGALMFKEQILNIIQNPTVRDSADVALMASGLFCLIFLGYSLRIERLVSNNSTISFLVGHGVPVPHDMEQVSPVWIFLHLTLITVLVGTMILVNVWLIFAR